IRKRGWEKSRARGPHQSGLEKEDFWGGGPGGGVYRGAGGGGGRWGGGLASKTAVNVFSKVFAQRHPDDLRTVIENTIELCNQKIYEDAQSSADLEGMATTIAMLAVGGRRAIIAHVGDSRG